MAVRRLATFDSGAKPQASGGAGRPAEANCAVVRYERGAANPSGEKHFAFVLRISRLRHSVPLVMTEAKHGGFVLAGQGVGGELAIALRAQIVAPLLIDVVADRVALRRIDALQDFVNL